jgi:hypothetical protein
MLTDIELDLLEKKYFNIIEGLLSSNIGRIISQIYSQSLIIEKSQGMKDNIIEHAIENIIEAIISGQLSWNICSLPISSDSCYECGDAVVHIDAKTMKVKDGDYVNNKLNVQNSQTSYDYDKSFIVSGKNWKPKLKKYEKHSNFGLIPNLTYFVRVSYSKNHLVEDISLMTIPNGQFSEKFKGENILAAGKSIKRTNIRFQVKKILEYSSEGWRHKYLYRRNNHE